MKVDDRYFLKRKIIYSLICFVVIAIYILSAVITEFRMQQGIQSFGKAMDWMIHNLRINSETLKLFPKIIRKLWETILLSVAVTMIASICAFLFSLIGSNTMGGSKIISKLVRIFAAFFRNVPDVVWAMLLMFSFGQNILTGFFALFFTTFGMLTRAFIENIDEISVKCVEALHSTGANFQQIVCQGIIPTLISSIVSWILYMIETNIRSSTLIGILTATGIGYLFDLYYKRLNFSAVSLIVLSTVIVVIAIELISNGIRKVIE